MRIKLAWMPIAISMSIISSAFAASPPKKLPAQRFTGTIKIDGDLNDSPWKDAPAARGFSEWRPAFGALEKHESRTEVFILYDDNAVYVAGHCYERSSDSVSRELAGRDKVGSNDFIGVIFDTYNDKINASGFYVTPLGEQYDAKYSNTNGEDDTWNAVWESAAKILNDGWTFELKIPYSALRFSGKGTEWGLNITRRRQKTGQQYMWNPVDPTINGFINQEGLWTDIKNIKPPVRLSLSPYFSTYVNHYKNNSPDVDGSLNGGMDVKYGISPSLTLDMTLIPDFGQVASDRTILNLSPFEVKYADNRPFFTEGTELFLKGNLFYSRRIGGQPIHRDEIPANADEVIIENPLQSKLVNATKLSGRNQKGFAVGILNALAKPTYAQVENLSTHQKRKIQTSTLTNYNIVVLDQTLKNNSAISLVNTNVMRSGHDYDANVTAAVFDFNNKKNIYNVNGKIALSNILAPGNNVSGYSHSVGIGKTGGRFNFNVSQELVDDKYNSNDLGLLFNNNYLDHYFWTGYKWVKPGKWYNNLYFNINNTLSYRFTDGAFQTYSLNINLNGQLKNLWYAGAAINYNSDGHDFYEPRKAGRMFRSSRGIGPEIWFSSNSAKKYYFSFDAGFTARKQFNGRSYFMYIENRYRFNDQFSLSLTINPSPAVNNVGFAGNEADGTILFSRRDRKTFDNYLGIKYNFSKNAGITANVRHYWSKVSAKEFYVLTDEGKLMPGSTSATGLDADYNVNIFNVDVVYTWQFSPGSFLYLVWKNGVNNFEEREGYFKNLNSTLGSAQNNNLSLKVIYYLDYLKLRKNR